MLRVARLPICSQLSCGFIALAMRCGEPPQPFLPVASRSTPFHAVLLVDRQGCEGRLGFAHIFESPARTGRLAFEGIAAFDAPGAISSDLDDLHLPISSASRTYSKQFPRERYARPLLVIYDREHVIRITIEAPVMPQSERVLAATLRSWLRS